MWRSLPDCSATTGCTLICIVTKLGSFAYHIFFFLFAKFRDCIFFPSWGAMSLSVFYMYSFNKNFKLLAKKPEEGSISFIKDFVKLFKCIKSVWLHGLCFRKNREKMYQTTLNNFCKQKSSIINESVKNWHINVKVNNKFNAHADTSRVC